MKYTREPSIEKEEQQFKKSAKLEKKNKQFCAAIYV
jgi:hypothetical protein